MPVQWLALNCQPLNAGRKWSTRNGAISVSMNQPSLLIRDANTLRLHKFHRTIAHFIREKDNFIAGIQFDLRWNLPDKKNMLDFLSRKSTESRPVKLETHVKWYFALWWVFSAFAFAWSTTQIGVNVVRRRHEILNFYDVT